ncbi:hypothetical protein BU15DRAFT_71184 [Melanogaster broomeanus]|nr:hypothetical protein BU15DRAFT_71184 [Melanogaster broomeanus]
MPVPPSVLSERTPVRSLPPPPSTTTPIPRLAIQTLPDGPWPGSARKIPSDLAENGVSNDDTPSSTFPAISRDRAGDRKNQGRPRTRRRPPGLRFTEPTWGLQQKSRRSGRSSLRYTPFFAVAGGSGCTRDQSSWSTTLVLWKTALPLWRTTTTSSCTIPAQYPLPPLLCHIGHTITTTLQRGYINPAMGSATLSSLETALSSWRTTATSSRTLPAQHPSPPPLLLAPNASK